MNQRQIHDNSRNRMKAHLQDFETMYKLIPKHHKEAFTRDYVRAIGCYVPLRYRTSIVHTLKRHYGALVYYPLP